MFLDEVTIFVKAGRGGDGCVSFRREKHVPRGGPDGGDGGRGGHVIFEVNPHLHTLLDLRYKQYYSAGRGSHGMGKKMHGRNGDDAVICVPPGTTVTDAESDKTIAELTKPGQRKIVALGGKGGRGNAHFATSTNRTPRVCEEGVAGQELTLQVELKLMTDVGLVGLPNAGKSTLLARLSAARPKIADYPFTTLQPHLGIVRRGEYQSFVMADIPGLIEGAHKGRGLGTRFLRHIERTEVLVFLLDCASSDVTRDLKTLQKELGCFNPKLLKKKRIIAITKIDLLTEREQCPVVETNDRVPVCHISSVSGEGLDTLLKAIDVQLER
ncbi:MAG: GTPase ObgE [Gemmatimonadota bacterium]|nr:MAG: GTPase ObgE [Gemmatimonadota bacterium]